jgi:membrane-bound lytic murein transglycosylase MltF
MQQLLTKNGGKSLKAILIASLLIMGMSWGSLSVNGEELDNDKFAEYNAIPEEFDECSEIVCEEIEVEYDLSHSEKSYEDEAKKRPDITWEKNAKRLGDFDPDIFYVLEDAQDTFTIVEKETMPNKDKNVHFLAVAMDLNENDYYTFLLTYANDGQDWEAEFENFVTSFKK